jgi:hypothetical protein
MKETIIEFFKSSKARTFYWQTANGFVLLIVAFLTQIQPDIIDTKALFFIAAAISGLNAATKYINQNYL